MSRPPCPRRAALRARLALDEIVRAGTPVEVRVRGDSMVPTVADGRRIRVEPLGTHRPRAGEVVVLARGCTWTLHRVLRATRRQVWTRGDARLSADPAFPAGAVVGRVPSLPPRPLLAILGSSALWAAARLRGLPPRRGPGARLRARLAGLLARSTERVARPLESLV
ncbi:MAG: S24/S26 family peptidase [Planctomycetes bacterium]|nr:S24/S26 family peptidase [Planctomycetota bacterium]